MGNQFSYGKVVVGFLESHFPFIMVPSCEYQKNYSKSTALFFPLSQNILKSAFSGIRAARVARTSSQPSNSRGEVNLAVVFVTVSATFFVCHLIRDDDLKPHMFSAHIQWRARLVSDWVGLTKIWGVPSAGGPLL